MPTKSKAQFRLFQAAAHGSVKLPGMSKEQAAEFVACNKGEKSYKHLPEFKKLKEHLRSKK